MIMKKLHCKKDLNPKGSTSLNYYLYMQGYLSNYNISNYGRPINSYHFLQILRL